MDAIVAELRLLRKEQTEANKMQTEANKMQIEASKMHTEELQALRVELKSYKDTTKEFIYHHYILNHLQLIEAICKRVSFLCDRNVHLDNLGFQMQRSTTVRKCLEIHKFPITDVTKFDNLKPYRTQIAHPKVTPDDSLIDTLAAAADLDPQSISDFKGMFDCLKSLNLVCGLDADDMRTKQGKFVVNNFRVNPFITVCADPIVIRQHQWHHLVKKSPKFKYSHISCGRRSKKAAARPISAQSNHQ